jgi:hypothetical protein
MPIAVIADTHDRLPGHVRDAIAAADEIWHLGDVCSQPIVDSLESLSIPLLVIRGNCDSDPTWPLSIDCERAGLRIQLVHIPPRLAPAGAQVVLHGHTHVPRDETVGGVRFLNPGCITRPNRGAPASYAWLELREGAPLIWTLVRV